MFKTAQLCEVMSTNGNGIIATTDLYRTEHNELAVIMPSGTKYAVKVVNVHNTNGQTLYRVNIIAAL